MCQKVSVVGLIQVYMFIHVHLYVCAPVPGSNAEYPFPLLSPFSILFF